jgi:hypothetical protein
MKDIRTNSDSQLLLFSARRSLAHCKGLLVISRPRATEYLSHSKIYLPSDSIGLARFLLEAFQPLQIDAHEICLLEILKKLDFLLHCHIEASISPSPTSSSLATRSV